MPYYQAPPSVPNTQSPNGELVADQSEEIDIDLNDPEVEKAAVKIQSGFRGMKTRSELTNKQVINKTRAIILEIRATVLGVRATILGARAIILVEIY